MIGAAKQRKGVKSIDSKNCYRGHQGVRRKRRGFTLIEILISMTILSLSLVAIYQAFATTVFILSSTDRLWRAMTYSSRELLKWERAERTSVGVVQGKFDLDHELADFEWRRTIKDTNPMPGITVRMVQFDLSWKEGDQTHTHESKIFIKPK